ncbi:MAG: tRNA (adenosine(37)-N6)-threonylcarbamoyltransferase complex dimerization subunit type 1 TsaB [Bacilli bacterium]|nr:tRNA (adenosine(37)-N6)-threonylcarbamoyltransferase complex dimerization subunit type 1 TsaB [Bacilli bacterium]
MLRLFLNTSNKYLFIALMKDDNVIDSVLMEGNNNHSEKLIDVLKEFLNKNCLSVDDIKEIYVGRGPGSYTGVRIACTVAKVMAFIKNKKLYSFSSLDLLLSTKLDKVGTYKVLMDARRGNSFAKVVEVKEDIVEVIFDEAFVENEYLENNYPNLDVITSEDTKYNLDLLLKYNLVKEEKDIHAFVPTYLRSGV